MQYLTKDTSLEEMYKVAQDDGVFIIQNYLEGQELEDLKSNVLSEIKNKAGHYEFGRNLCRRTKRKRDILISFLSG